MTYMLCSNFNSLAPLKLTSFDLEDIIIAINLLKGGKLFSEAQISSCFFLSTALMVSAILSV